MLRIITANLNGIRSAAKKGFLEWASAQQTDVLCVQELKAQAPDMTPQFQTIGSGESALIGHFHYAEKKGYSGAGLYCKKAIDRTAGFGSPEFDAEGRIVQADLHTSIGPLSVISVYVPSGSSSEERQAAKFRFMAQFYPYLQQLRASGNEIVVCGDWNIAHKEIDLKNWKGNLKNSGFLPEERAWLTQVFDELGYVDVHRSIDPSPDLYTWWSNRGAAYEKNVGWRIDYQIATPKIAALARHASVYKAEKFSDHAPLTIDYDCNLLP